MTRPSRSWVCICSCGKRVVRKSCVLLTNAATSCGCMKGSRMSNMTKIHGGSKTITYASWKAMRGRCRDENHPSYKDYGGRGIQVCERWFSSFAAFLEDMGERPSKAYTIDRFPNNDGNYEPGNCRWATDSEQKSNKRSSRLVSHDGLILTVKQWSVRLGISDKTIIARLNRGHCPSDALCKDFHPRHPI